MSKERVLYIRLIVIIGLAVSIGILGAFLYVQHLRKVCDRKELCIAFLDVGQGDAIFIQSPSGQQMLVDGGRDTTVLERLTDVMPYSDRTLDYIVATHPDADHIGGLTPVIERYTVATVLTTDVAHDTHIVEAFEKAVSDEKAVRIYAQAGQVYDLGSGVTVSVLHPFVDEAFADTNSVSIVLLVEYGNASYMLTGDAPQLVEYQLIHAYGNVLRGVDILKLGHHGSKTSSNTLFLELVDPVFGIISAGKDNSYGHPHQDVIERAREEDIRLISTVDNGTVITETDGEVITVRRVR